MSEHQEQQPPADVERPIERRSSEPVDRTLETARNAEILGQGVGGVSGTLIGVALGALAGPLGPVIGGIAGAVGGWWTRRAVAESAMGITPEHDEAYREHFESLSSNEPLPVGKELEARRYEDIWYAYHLGHIARANPDYADRPFEEVEPDLRHGWDEPARLGDWIGVRHYAEAAYSGTVQQRRLAADTRRLGGTPRNMTPTEEARDRLHSDTTTG